MSARSDSRPDGHLRLLLPLLVILAQLPLAYAESSLTGVGLLIAAPLIGWWWIDRRGGRGLPSWLGTVLVLLATVYLVYEWWKSQPVLALSHYVVFMCMLKFVQRRGPRDYAQLVVLAMLLLIIGGVVNESLVYAVCLLVFLAGAMYSVLLLHFGRESERVDQRRRAAGLPTSAASSTPLPAPSLRSMTALSALGTFVVGVIIFLVFPRLSGGLFDGGVPALPGSVTGYAPELKLGAAGNISESDGPVMRVVIKMDGKPIDDPAFQGYYRANTFDRYVRHESGVYTWESSASRAESGGRRIALTELSPLQWLYLTPLQPSRAIEQHYFINSLRDRYLFAIHPATAIQSEKLGRAITLRKDHSIRVLPSVGGTVDYKVISALAGEDPTADQGRWLVQPDAEPADADDSAIGPDSPVRQKVQELVSRLGDDPRPDAVADAVVRFLNGPEFGYTLDESDADPRREPVEDLLFHRRRGHCEYYASAMTVMCQLAGLDARLAQGYHGGEYNSVGGYYQIRRRDAHAWVEVRLPRRGWVTYDPSPLSDSRESPGTGWATILRQYLDNMQFQWVNFVVAYGSQNQGELKRQVDAWLAAANDPRRSRMARWWGIVRSFAVGEGLRTKDRVVYWAALLAFLTLSYVWVRLVVRLCARLTHTTRRAWRARRAAPRGGVEFYERLLRLLARRGIEKPAEQTPREFARRVVQIRPEWRFVDELTRHYYRVRFGAAALSAEQLKEVDGLVARLEA